MKLIKMYCSMFNITKKYSEESFSLLLLTNKGD